MDETYVLTRRRFPEIDDLEETIVAYLAGRFKGISRRSAEDLIRGSMAYYVALDGRAYLAFDEGGSLLPHMPLMKEEAGSLSEARMQVAALVEGGKFALVASYQFEEALPAPAKWGPVAAQMVLSFFEGQYQSLALHRLRFSLGGRLGHNIVAIYE